MNSPRREFYSNISGVGHPAVEVDKVEWLRLWQEEAEFQWKMAVTLGISVLVGKKFYKPKEESK